MGIRRVLAEDRGQATVEAAFALPVMMLLVLMLIQPGIILYDRMVMHAAAAEGCRLLATSGADDVGMVCEDYVRRRLGAVPQQDIFHVHDSSCSWDIRFVGDASSSEVSVSISNELKPLPLLSAGIGLLGMLNGEGNIVIEVAAAFPTQPSWVAGSVPGYASTGWVGAWLT